MTTAELTIGPVRTVVPGPGLPTDLAIGRSNNNLDITEHGGRRWLAWRSAPTHFASEGARIHAVSSSDGGRNWVSGLTVAPGRDVREPRFFECDGRLHLTWFTAGTKGTAFQPDRVWITHLDGDTWVEPTRVGPPDTVVWRVRPIGGRLVMSVYRHAATLFSRHPRTLEVELWTSKNGYDWSALYPDHPVIHTGGSETEFIELPDGRVLFVVRKEGPDGGWGSDLTVVTPADDGSLGDPADWVWRSDDRKFDSPLLFLAGGSPVLVTRRQVAFGGRYRLARGRNAGSSARPADVRRTRLYQGLYWLTPKRTAVYGIDPDTLDATHLSDLPSNGDTAFAGHLALDDDRHLIANYSSRWDRHWWPWALGQLRPTMIYTCELHL